MVFLREFFQKVYFEKKISRQQKIKKNYPVCNELSFTLCFLGVSYITEIQHPYDKEPSLFQCDLCRHSCTAKEIVQHIVTKKHHMEFFVRTEYEPRYKKTGI